MKYQLKKEQEAFDVVDGEFAGRKFVKGKIYEEIPPQEKHRFEKIPEPKKTENPKPPVMSKSYGAGTTTPETEVKK